MVIDNIWKQGKISETVYKYLQVCYLLPTDYKLIFWTSSRWPLFTSMHCCKRVWKLPYTRLRRSLSIAVTSSTMACLSSWIVMIRLRNTRSFRNRHRKKCGTVRSGDWAGQAMSPKLRTQVTRCCTFRRSIATAHMKWRPLLYRSPSRQPRLTIALVQYSNLKCVSLLRAILFIYIYVMGQDSSVGIATRYRLDGPGIESWWGARFSATGPGAHPAFYTMGTGSFFRG